MGLKIRTDLALEAKESLDEDGSLNGVVFDEQTDGSCLLYTSDAADE